MKICKVCFKNIENETFLDDLFNIKTKTLCYSCYQKMELIMKNVKIQKKDVFVLIKYNNYIKEQIYKFKGLYDIELKTIFLEYFKDELEDKYFGYTITFAPSYKDEDIKRGFNHVQEMFSILKNKKIICFSKKENIKQSSQNKKDRANISKIIELDESKIKGIKKLLIVDDIVTTGNTLISCYNLAKKIGVKKVKLLSVCQSKSQLSNNVELSRTI